MKYQGPIRIVMIAFDDNDKVIEVEDGKFNTIRFNTLVAMLSQFYNNAKTKLPYELLDHTQFQDQKGEPFWRGNMNK